MRRYIRAHKMAVVQNNRASATVEVNGLLIEQNVLGAITMGADVNALRIWQTSEAAVTMAQAYCIYATNYILSNSNLIMMRLDDHGDQTAYCFLFLCKGQGDVSYLMHLRPGDTSAWRQTDLLNMGSNSGWLRIRVHNADRYIALYSAVA